MCGDEPHTLAESFTIPDAFPTCVGMNRGLERCNKARQGVPYMCGDEPANQSRDARKIVRSLHVWG